MASPVLVLADHSVDRLNFMDVLEFCRSFADFLQKPVDLGIASIGVVEAANTSATTGGASFATIEPRLRNTSAPMSSAEFLWNDDGSPDWGAMWTGFCDLALYGGPSHRGLESALSVPSIEQLEDRSDIDAIVEIQRGIMETTGLESELDPNEPGWLKVTTFGPKMAAWISASIILENVSARSRDQYLYVPASPHFTLKDQVKSVITVVAKTNHYWQEHITAQYGNGWDGHFH